MLRMHEATRNTEASTSENLFASPEVDFSAWRSEQVLPHYVYLQFDATSLDGFRESQEVTSHSVR